MVEDFVYNVTERLESRTNHRFQTNCEEILQAEGCHQGDPLAPALYSLAQHQALENASRQLAPGEYLAAYLDDIYIVVPPHRARPAYNVVAHELNTHAAVAPNPSKTRVYNGQGGVAPEGIQELGPDVWRGNRPLHEQGILTLGTPIGTPAFVSSATAERLRDEQTLLDQLHRLPDLQSAWLLLLYCCAPRAQHILRTVPPDQSAEYGRRGLGHLAGASWRSCGTSPRRRWSHCPRKIHWPITRHYGRDWPHLRSAHCPGSILGRLRGRPPCHDGPPARCRCPLRGRAPCRTSSEGSIPATSQCSCRSTTGGQLVHDSRMGHPASCTGAAFQRPTRNRHGIPGVATTRCSRTAHPLPRERIVAPPHTPLPSTPKVAIWAPCSSMAHGHPDWAGAYHRVWPFPNSAAAPPLSTSWPAMWWGRQPWLRSRSWSIRRP